MASGQPILETSEARLAASDERDLVRRSNSDPRAAGLLYRRHHAAITRYVRRRVGCQHTTEDLVAETFMAMVSYLPKYRMRGVPFRAWLYRLASTQVNRWVRRRQLSSKLATNPSSATAERKDIEQIDAADQARTALLALPPHLQTVLALYYLEELSVAQIAQVQGCAVGTVKSRLARARNRMRANLPMGEHNA